MWKNFCGKTFGEEFWGKKLWKNFGGGQGILVEEFSGGISIYLILCSEEGGGAVNISENFWL